MYKLNQRGFAHVLILLLLVVGLAVGVFLVQQKTSLFPKADVSGPVMPETSFSLVGPSNCTAGFLCILTGQHALAEEFTVKLYARSDLETANLFTAKMSFPKDLVEITSIQTTDSFVKNWIENFYDNNTGEVSLSGGVPSPGYQTKIGTDSGLMATITFRAKSIGKGSVVFTDSSAIYSNLNNINILTIKRPYDFSIDVNPPPMLTPPPPTLSSRVFVTSTSYNGNLGGLAGADAKCQERADAANLGGTWKAWLSNSDISAAKRLTHSNGQYRTLDEKIIANNWADLTDKSLQNLPIMNELKKNYYGAVWTGTNYDGSTPIGSGSSNHCRDWNSNSSADKELLIGLAGNNQAPYYWTSVDINLLPLESFGCNNNYALYCFEQNPSSSQCLYDSTQARLQKDLSDPWASSKTINAGDKIRVGGFHNNTGLLAPDVDLGVTGPQECSSSNPPCPQVSISPANGDFITPPSTIGTYTLSVKTKGQSGSNCQDIATFQVQKCTPRPACLDAKPACMIPEPADGWCPTPAPTCTPLPSCWWSTGEVPPCRPPEPLGGWCPSPLPTPTTTKGDGNKDGKINLIDMSVIHTDWMKTKDSSTAFRDGIDMNSDGVINTFDFALHRQLLLSLGVIKGAK